MTAAPILRLARPLGTNMSLRSPILIVATVCASASCGGDGGQQATSPVPTTTAPVPAAIALVSGGGQTGIAGSALASPLIVRVADAAGTAVPGVSVSWTVTVGGGSLSAASTTTDASGRGQVSWTLGRTAGSNTVTASMNGLAPVTF